MKGNRLVVKSHRPFQFALAVILLSVLMSFATWLFLDKSHWSVIQDRFDDSRDRRLLWEVNKGLEEENRKLHERVLVLERSTGLDQQTAVLTQGEIRDLQEEVFRLKEELEFYQGIMESAGEGKGLNVQGVHVVTLSRSNGYRLKVILTHVTNSNTFAEGEMGIAIEGIQGGDTRQLDLAALTLDEPLDLVFKFRNFKRFESNLELPAGFTPRRIFIELQPKDAKQSKISKVFDWPTGAG